MNNTETTNSENMVQRNWITYCVIAVCILITQIVAYFATPYQPLNGSRYFLNAIALYVMAVQWIVFIHAAGFFGNERTEKYYDLTGSLTFLSTLALSLFFIRQNINVRQIILSTFVAIWSARLGLFLFTRIHGNNGVDSRFTLIKQSRPRFLMAWTMQGLWCFLTMLPILVLNLASEAVAIGIFDYIGMPLWIVGFSFEVILFNCSSLQALTHELL